MQIQWLKGGEQEKHRFSESQCYANEGEEFRRVCKHITDFFVSLRAGDAKLTLQHSLISVKMCQLHELLAPPRRAAQILSASFMDYKASVRHQRRFLVFYKVHCTL